MTENVDKYKNQEKDTEKKWYTTFWDHVFPDEPESEEEYSGMEKKDISENMKKYLKYRFKGTRKYCKKRVRQSMYNFFVVQIITILVSALIPIINVTGFGDNFLIRMVSSVLGSIIVILTGFLQLFKLYEKWILFMSTVDSLEFEYYNYVYGLPTYSTSNDPDKLFVQKIESIILAKGERYLANIDRTKTSGKDSE
jgi:hypothetical protein